MRGKPNISRFQAKTAPSEAEINAFIEGGQEVVVPSEHTGRKKVDKPITHQKIFRLSNEVINGLKLHLAQQQAQTGHRVSETEVVETLLRGFLKLSK